MSNSYTDIITKMARGEAPSGESAPSPYRLMLDEGKRQREAQARLSLSQNLDSNPEQASEALNISERNNVPFPVVNGSYEDFRRLDKQKELMRQIRGNPALEGYYANPVNVQIAHDDAGALSDLSQFMKEFIFNNYKAIGIGVGQTVGGSMSGVEDTRNFLKVGMGKLFELFGDQEMADAYYRDARRLRDKSGTPLPGSLDVEAANRANGGSDAYLTGFDPTSLQPAPLTEIPHQPGMVELISQAGDELKRWASDNAIPENEANAMTDLMQAVGSLFSFAGMNIVSPGAATGAMFTSGADIMGDRARAAGATQQQEAAAAAGGAMITGLSERTGLDLILKRGVPAIQNIMRRYAADLGAAFGIEFTEEYIEALGHNIVAKLTYDPNIEIMQMPGAEEFSAGGAAMLLRGIVHVLGGRQTIMTQDELDKQQAERQQGVFRLMQQKVTSSKAYQRNVRSFEEFANKTLEGNEDAAIYLDITGAREYFQAAGVDVPALFQQLGVEDQVNELSQTGGDVRIPLAKFMALSGSEHFEPLLMDVRAKQTDDTLREVLTRTEDQQQRIIAEGQKVMAEEAANDEFTKSADRVFTEYKQMAVDAGLDSRQAESVALLNQAFAATIARETGKLPYDAYMERAQRIRNRSLDVGPQPLTDEEGYNYSQAGELLPQGPAFEKWFGDSKVPGVVYHGTTHDIEQFGMGRANIENDMGAGFYFSNTIEDVNANYAGEGPDLTARISARSERIFDEIQDDPEAFGYTADQIESMDDAEINELSKRLARDELSGGAPNVMPVYVSLQNPVILGGRDETMFTYELVADVEAHVGDAREELGPEADEDEVQDRAREMAYENDDLEEEGNLKAFLQAVVDTSYEFDGADVDSLIDDALEHFDAYDEAEIPASDLIQYLREYPGLAYVYDPGSGAIAGSELIRRAMETAGYDGIVDNTVNQKFGTGRAFGSAMEGVFYDTVHYIAFRPEQIKSVFNRGTFDPRNPNVLFQSEASMRAEDREWRNWMPEETSTGKFKGAPEWVKDRKDLARMRRLMNKLVQEGMVGRYWYEQSAKAVMDIVGGDVRQAEKFIQLIAIYSPKASVATNTLYAIRAWNQWKNGVSRDKFKVTQADRDAKAVGVLYDDEPFEGRKTNSFYLNLMHDIYASNPDAVDQLQLDEDIIESLSKPATIDVWMLRAFGFKNDGTGDDKGSGHYSFSENEIRRITARLNDSGKYEDRWTPHQVQAVIWSAMKARYELDWVKAATWAESLRKGLAKIDEETGRPTIKGMTASELRQHRAIWRKHAMKATSAEATEASVRSASDFGHYLEQNTRAVTWEALPSPALNLDINGAPPAVIERFTNEARELLMVDGVDVLAAKLGVPLAFISTGHGAYGGEVTSNSISHLIPDRNAGEFGATEARLYAAALQYIFKQNAVPWFRADVAALNAKKAQEEQKFRVINVETGRVVPKSRVDTLAEAQAIAQKKGAGFEVRGGKYAKGIRIKFNFNLDLQSERDLLTLLAGVLGEDAGFTRVSPDTVAIINYRDDETKVPFVDDEVFTSGIEGLAQQLNDLGAEEWTGFWSEGEYGNVHDWQNDPEGRALLEDPGRLAGRPDLQDWIRDRRKAFDALLEEYSGDRLALREGESRTLYQSAVIRDRYGREIPADDVWRKAPRYSGGRAAGAVSAPAVHFSKASRTELDSGAWGRGMRDAASDRVANSDDERLKHRIYFYLQDDDGGVRPEGGVGANAHVVILDNLYDPKADPAGLSALEGNEFESAVLDAGYDGYIAEVGSGKSALRAAVLLGERKVPVADIGYEYEANQLLKTQPPARRFFQAAYHGSPHRFNRFSTEKIGAGEGAQAYGWGLYFAGRKEVAKWYKERLSSSVPLSWKGQSLYDIAGASIAELDDKYGDFSIRLAIRAYQRGGSIDEAIGILRDRADAESGAAATRAQWAIDFLTNEREYLDETPSGRLYSVELAPTEDEYLLWDKPWDQQPEKVQNALGLAEMRDAMDNFLAGKITQEEVYKVRERYPLSVGFRGKNRYGEVAKGRDIYEHMQARLMSVHGRTIAREIAPQGANGGAAEIASKFLHSVGVRGIKYLDGSSRDRGEGNYNYVIFNDQDVEITSYEQRKGSARGQITFPAGGLRNGESIITLFQNADPSTLVHETAHFFLETYLDLARTGEASARIMEDVNALLSWWGVDSINDVGVEQHELFARGFEAYLREGKAPIKGLRGVFEKFAAWLTRLYRDVKALNVEINEEVTQVFDRMLASDEQLAQAAAGDALLFDSAEDAGMTQKAFDDLVKLQAQAKEAAAGELRATLLASITAELDEGWVEAYNRIEDKVRDELSRERAHILRALLTTGMLPGNVDDAEWPGGKLNRDAIITQFGDAPDAIWRLLPSGKKHGVMAKGGELDPEMVAARFGYQDVGDMLTELSQTPVFEKAVKTATEARVREEYGDVTTDARKLEKAVQDARHNAEAAEVAIVELRALENKLGAGATTKAQLKEAAKQILAKRKVSSIKEWEFLRAERKAIAEAAASKAKGNLGKAAFWKRRQLMNHFLYMEARDANKMIDKAVKDIRKFDRKSTRTRLSKSMEFLSQIDALTWQYDFRVSVSQKALAERATLRDFVDQQQAAGLPIDIPAKVIENARRISYKELSLEELRDVLGTIKHLETLARMKDRLMRAAAKQSLEETVAAVVNSMETNREDVESGVPVYGEGIPEEMVKRWRKVGASLAMKEFVFRRLDGDELGPVWDALWWPLEEAALASGKMKAEASAYFKEALSVYSKRERARFGGAAAKKYHVQGFGTFTKEELISIALNSGNEGNYSRLTGGNRFSPQQIDSALALLDHRDWAFVQKVWDYYDHVLWPQVRDMEERLTGLAPEKVIAAPQYQPEGFPLRGGYFPIRYNADYSERTAQLDESASVQDIMGGQWARAGTRKGHIEARLEEVSRPLKLSLNVVVETVNNVIQDLTHREAVIDIYRIIKDDEFTDTFKRKAGTAMYRALLPWLREAAGAYYEPSNALDKFWGWARGRTSIVGIGMSFSTALINATGISVSMDELGPLRVMKQVAKFYGHPLKMKEMADFVADQSEYMAQRHRAFDREVGEQLRDLNAKGNLTPSMGTWYIMINWVDKGVSIPTWMAAYDKGLEDYQGDEARARQYADHVIRTTQGSGRAIDQPKFMQDGELQRLTTVFFSYFNMIGNRMGRQGDLLRRRGMTHLPRFVAGMAFLWLIPAVMEQLMKGNLTGDDDDDDEKQSNLIRALATYPAQTLPLFRDLTNAAWGYLDPNTPSFGYQVTPAGDVVDAMIKTLPAAVDVARGEGDKTDAKNLLMGASYALGLPGRQLWRSTEHMINVSEGDDFSPQKLMMGE